MMNRKAILPMNTLSLNTMNPMMQLGLRHSPQAPMPPAHPRWGPQYEKTFQPPSLNAVPPNLTIDDLEYIISIKKISKLSFPRTLLPWWCLLEIAKSYWPEVRWQRPSIAIAGTHLRRERETSQHQGHPSEGELAQNKVQLDRGVLEDAQVVCGTDWLQATEEIPEGVPDRHCLHAWNELYRYYHRAQGNDLEDAWSENRVQDLHQRQRSLKDQKGGVGLGW